jgi:hypothetical protein
VGKHACMWAHITYLALICDHFYAMKEDQIKAVKESNNRSTPTTNEKTASILHRFDDSVMESMDIRHRIDRYTLDVGRIFGVSSYLLKPLSCSNASARCVHTEYWIPPREPCAIQFDTSQGPSASSHSSDKKRRNQEAIREGCPPSCAGMNRSSSPPTPQRHWTSVRRRLGKFRA